MYDDNKTTCNVTLTALPSTNVWTRVLAFNNRRRSIILSPISGLSIVYTFQPNPAPPASGLPPGITVAQSPVILTRRDIGDVIMQELYCCSTFAFTIAVTEFIDDPCDGVKQ